MSHLAKKDSIIERMFTVESFTKAFASTSLAGQTLTTNDIQILLKYLQRDKRVLQRDGDVSPPTSVPPQCLSPDHFQPTLQTIKIVKTEEEYSQGITEAEKGILQVKDTSILLEKQIDDLEHRISE